VVLRTALEAMTSTGLSAMPEGFEKDLKPQDVADVIAFVRSSGPLPQMKAFEGNHPELVRPAADGALHLLSANCEVYGTTLILEKQYGNLGYWSSADDHAIWSVEVGRAGKYAGWLDWACADDSAGNAYVLQAGGQRLTGTVRGTGDWDTYRQARVGAITLAAGRQRLVFRSAGKIKGALIDLKAIKLVPAA